MSSGKVILESKCLKVYYNVRRGVTSLVLRAVDGVDFKVGVGQIVGVVGESGCGKSTLARVLSGLEEPTAGQVIFDGGDVYRMPRKRKREFHRNVQMIFQDPYEAVNPRYTVFDTVAEGLRVQGVKDRHLLEDRVNEALDYVRLSPPESFTQRRPFELSGGQLQRVAIARALVLEPRVLLADEPVSMLDVSVRAEVLNTLIKAKNDKGMGVVFITHDIALADYVSEYIAVMYLGRIVEYGRSEDVLLNPLHPYTQAIIDAVPAIGKRFLGERELIRGEISSAMNIPSGCRFRNRCPYAQKICEEKEPQMIALGQSHYAACHFAGQVSPHRLQQQVPPH